MKFRYICAIISSLGAIGWSLVLLVKLLDRGFKGDAILFTPLVFLPAATTLYLIYSQKIFSNTAVEKMEEENKVLKLKIEQRKLKDSLEKSDL